MRRPNCVHVYFGSILMFCLYPYLLSPVDVRQDGATNADKSGGRRSDAQEEYLRYLSNAGVTTVKNTWGPRFAKHNLGMLSVRKTQPPLVYINVPKSGSHAFKAALSSSPDVVSFHRKVFLNELEKYKHLWHDQQPVVFSVVRHPEDRIASAYSTVVSRFNSFGLKGRTKLANINKPSSDDMSAWRDHFAETISMWMSTIYDKGWNHPAYWWNEHIIPQHDFLRGYNISFIGCLDNINATFQALNISGNREFSRNAYEHSGAMPKEKFQSFALLPEIMKDMVRELYKEDYEMYDTFCKE